MLFALILTVLAGLSTLIGGFLAMHRAMVRREVLAIALGFAAGAMLLVSFVEMIPVAQESIAAEYEGWAMAITLGSFFAGMAIIGVIDRFLPRSVNPSKREGLENQPRDGLSKLETKNLMRSGLLVAIAIGLHNFPEGLVTFVGALQDPQLGVLLAVAIAIHNIPEGIAVAAPVYAATHSRRQAFKYTAISGFAEPLGAVLGYVLFAAILPESLIGALFAGVAGMMVFISIDELLPAARRYATSDHQAVYGTIAGMAVMALSLVLLYF
tara:strand:+ start:811 stop:1614 length:804 start_codon:yes stop_codon:yes gene_type:complete